MTDTAIVTGGASGLGLALCRALQARGIHTVILDLRAPPRGMLNTTLCSYRWLDLQDTPTLLATLAEIHTSRGRIDWLINNASICVSGASQNLSTGDFCQVMAVNYTAAVEATLAVLPVMRAQRAGKVVNIASVIGLIPTPLLGPYGAAKAALVNFSESLRRECRRQGIRVVTVCPGSLDTPLFRKLSRPSGKLSADQAAELILQGVRRNRSPLIFPASARLAVWMHRNLPGFHALLTEYRRWLLNPPPPSPGGK